MKWSNALDSSWFAKASKRSLASTSVASTKPAWALALVPLIDCLEISLKELESRHANAGNTEIKVKFAQKTMINEDFEDFETILRAMHMGRWSLQRRQSALGWRSLGPITLEVQQLAGVEALQHLSWSSFYLIFKAFKAKSHEMKWKKNEMNSKLWNRLK